ncbi:MAG TPA: hypothetical protein VFQ51_13510, partial [Vicinamibacteria bacterium]|nr:hypothetical protein [Vicinamibacteria bacterium]
VPPGAPLVPPVPPGFDPGGAVSSAPHKGSSKKKVGLLAGVVVGAGAVVAGVAAGSSDASTPSTMLQPAFVRIQSSSPPFFSEVSVAANNMTLEVAVSTPRTLQPGEAWVILYHPVNHPAEQPCAVLAGPHPLLEAGREGRFVVRTPFLHAIPCGLSTLARVIFRTTSGQQILESGGANWLDGSAVYTWVP